MANISLQNPSIASSPYNNGTSNSTVIEKERELDGFVAFFLSENFIDVEFKDEKDKVKKTMKATQIQRITSQTPNMDSIVKTGRLVCVIFKNGDIQKLTVHPSWHNKMMQEQALELVMKINDEKGALIQSNIALVKMTEQSYQQMVGSFKLGHLL